MRNFDIRLDSALAPLPLPKQIIDSELVDELKRSKRILGELSPVIKNQKGQTLSGNHREGAGWKSIRIMETKDELEDLQIMQASNVQKTKSEDWETVILRKMCELVYKKTGMPKEKVGHYVATKVSTLAPRYAITLIPNEFKRPYIVTKSQTTDNPITKPTEIDGVTIGPIGDPKPRLAKHLPLTCPHCNQTSYLQHGKLVRELSE